jgi:replicative DNA helicase
VPIEICDRPAITLSQIRGVARRWRMKNAEGHGIVFVDYLQLVRGEKRGRESNREQEIAEVSRGLKALARELRVPVVPLAQLNRACEQRADKRPMLSDLRESGGIEQDADLVAFLYRDEAYTGENSKVPGTAEIIIRKNRHGPTSTIPVRFVAESVRFEPMASDEMRRYVETVGGKGE